MTPLTPREARAYNYWRLTFWSTVGRGLVWKATGLLTLAWVGALFWVRGLEEEEEEDLELDMSTIFRNDSE
jgi:hypothetical protein